MIATIWYRNGDAGDVRIEFITSKRKDGIYIYDLIKLKRDDYMDIRRKGEKSSIRISLRHATLTVTPLPEII